MWRCVELGLTDVSEERGYTEDHTKSINALYWQNREFLDDKAGGVTVLQRLMIREL
jgi:hypothetical protein